MKAWMRIAAVGIACLMGTTQARATDFDFSGTFRFDNDVLFFAFQVDVASNVTIFSSSWLQGEPPAGFDPMLGIWDAGGNLLQFQDDGGNTGSTMSNGVPYNHGVWDTYFSIALAPGSYFASITQYNNFPVGNTIAAGFIEDGNPNFTFDNGFGGATQPFFNGVWDNNDPRTGNWEFHLLNVEQASIGRVPEPSTILLVAAGLGVLAVRRRLHS